MKLVTSAQMRALEQRADRSGNTFAMMMERAGKAVADAIALRRDVHSLRVLVLVGPGNNGGDGLVCAHYLQDAGARVVVYLGKRTADDKDANLSQCRERGIPVLDAQEDTRFEALSKAVRECDVLVDALLGTGVTRPIEGILRQVLMAVKEEIGKRNRDLRDLVPPTSARETRHLERQPLPFVVAVDLPSGLNPDTGALDPDTLAADLTVTFALPKMGELSFPGARAVGELTVADIGILEEWVDAAAPAVASANEVAALLPARARDSHKGTFGKAMVCVGSTNYVGAAFLAGSAATRAGAGLATLALARTIYPIVASSSHETTFVILPDDLGALVPDAVRILRQQLKDYDALLIGCGFGRDVKTLEFVERLLAIGARPKSQIGFSSSVEGDEKPGKLPPLVIDADALFALAQAGEWWARLAQNAAILTPHPGEMAALCGLPRGEIQADRIGTAQRFAAQWHQVVVLKGAFTVVAAPQGRVTLLPFATPALATAGTGDVLAGTIVAMLAQGLEPFDAAVAGAYVHGLAGQIAEREIGAAGVVASDLLSRLPAAIRKTKDS
jgi:ADP-dependent NAD(P)H-hydrate dehydratase / NAD(P)H-hydrate epimerase